MSLFKKNQIKVQQNPLNIQGIQSLKTNRQSEITNYIVNQALYYNNNFYESEITMAKKLGCSRRSVIRAVKLAYDLGIIRLRHRFNDSNIYGVNPALRRPEIVDTLAGVLPALRGLLCLSMLIPLTVLCKPSTRPPLLDSGSLDKEEVYIFNSSLKLDTLYSKEGQSLESSLMAIIDQIALQTKRRREEKTLQGDMHNQQTRRSTMERPASGYCNERTALEYKEFMNERLPRLKESLNALNMDPLRKSETISRQIQAYVDRLHFKDIVTLRNEGYSL